MKKNRAYDALAYPFQKGEPILFDANVWIYLQPPSAQPPPWYAKSYGSVLKQILLVGAQPVIEALVLSEYLNRYWRVEWKTWLKANPALAPQFADGKAFRLSPHFISIGAAAIADAKRILTMCDTAGTPMQLCDLNDALAEFGAGSLDFNDAILVETCRLRGWKMLTHDRDMVAGGVEVLTTNPNLLKACTRV